jgi:formiminoglutamase
MEKLLRFTNIDLAKITNHRSGEVKFGEKMLTIPKDTASVASFLHNTSARYVLFGIPEDIGVRANYGRPGAHSAWECAIRSIANIQFNKFCKGNELLVLGQLNLEDEMKEAAELDYHKIADRKKFSDLVIRIDKEVAHLISIIVNAKKIPIIIGGGHNNSYGNIKGTALAKGKPVNAINFDAHSDFRILEGRHSGNGFSYAFEEGFLNKYFIFGLHENYTSKKVLSKIKKLHTRVRYNTYDEIGIRKFKNFDTELENAHKFIADEPFGIEIDLDAIPNIAASAMTISGFSVEQVRQFVNYFGKSQNAAYIHICEGAPTLGEEKNNHLIGKLMGYLITDFMKANDPLHGIIRAMDVNFTEVKSTSIK